jgi:hypothetical protein
VRAPGQVSWLSDRPTPRAFPAQSVTGQWLHAGFVPDYSDGVAADSHRLPWGSHLAGRPDANDAVTLADEPYQVNRSGRWVNLLCPSAGAQNRGARIVLFGPVPYNPRSTRNAHPMEESRCLSRVTHALP